MNGYKLPPGSLTSGMTYATDGTLWFADYELNSIEHMVKPGVFKQFSVPTSAAGVNRLCQAADGSIWFTESDANKIGRMTAVGKFQEFTIPTASSKPLSIVAGPDGAMWFTETIGQIGRVTPSGTFTELPVTTPYAQPFGITVGSDKNIWFTEFPGTLGRVELNQVKDSQPKYSSFTLSLEKRPQLGVPTSIPLQVQVRDLACKAIKGKYPYPVHLTTSDPKNAALSLHVLTSSATKVNVKFSGHYTDATIGANADGGGSLLSATVLPSTPKEQKLAKPAFNLAAGSNNSVWMCLPDGRIAERSLDGSIQYYQATNLFEQNGCSMVEGPDGNVWFTDYANDRIGDITPQGQVTLQQLHRSARPSSIALGSDGALWFTETGLFKIARMTTDGQLQTYPTSQTPVDIIAGPDGNLWFDDTDGGLYKLSTSGVKQKISHGFETGGEIGSANGSIWFLHGTGLAQMSVDGKIVHTYAYPGNCVPLTYASTPNGDLWFYDDGHDCVGRLTPSGTLTTVPTFNQKTDTFSFGGIIYGPNNDLWFAEPSYRGLGSLDPKTM
jgi:streptogramin lyase